MSRPILITAGGTGGHVFPALAVASLLREQGVPLVWLGTRGGIEARLVPAHGYPLETVAVAGLRGKGWRRRLAAPFEVARAVLGALRLLHRLQPRLVLGMGGFAAGPAGLAAWLARVPLLVHEQNAVAGLTNRLLAPLASRVLQAFPGAFAPGRAPVTTGNPVRQSILALPAPEARAAYAAAPLRVLVLGGSQGAAFLNETVPAACATLGTGACEIRHQAGERDRDATAARYAALGLAAAVEAFIDDMAGAYGWAQVVICRSGALTVAELAAAGVAAVLVPFPHAVDDHQTANARWLTGRGAAVLVPQSECDAGRLGRLLAEFAAAPARLLEMARAARGAARPDAAAAVAAACLEVARA